MRGTPSPCPHHNLILLNFSCFTNYVCVCVCVCEVAQSCLTLCDPVDCSLPGSSVHGILQARILEWVAIAFSRGSSQPRDRTRVSCFAGRRFILWATREAFYGLKISLQSSFRFCWFPVRFTIFSCDRWPFVFSSLQTTFWSHLFIILTGPSLIHWSIEALYMLFVISLCLLYSKYFLPVYLLLEKTLMLGKIEGMRRRGWQRMRWLDGITHDGHEFEQAPGVGDGQGSLVCCSPWGHKESDTTERLIWTELISFIF